MGSWYVFYFMFVVFFGSFYLLNLVLAVVAVSYQQEVVAMQDKVGVYPRAFLDGGREGGGDVDTASCSMSVTVAGKIGTKSNKYTIVKT